MNRGFQRLSKDDTKISNSFNLKDDPNQTTDIAAENPELLRRMKSKLLEINRSIMSDGHDWHLN